MIMIALWGGPGGAVGSEGLGGGGVGGGGGACHVGVSATVTGGKYTSETLAVPVTDQLLKLK